MPSGPDAAADARDVQPAARRFVVVGGGTGISPCLKGLKQHGHRVTALVTVADDGGSSGRLRKLYDIPPPGDIRNSLVALADADPLIVRMFEHRFEDSVLRGHSFGNLVLAVLTRLTGDFRQAIEEAGRILEVRGDVLPSTDTRVVLVADHPDGSRSTGEQVISRCGRPIVSMALRPRPGPLAVGTRRAIMDADLIVLGPGSLYTSIIPNLLVPGMAAAIAEAPAPVVLVGNLMTQPGETDQRSLDHHLEAIIEVGGLDGVDYLVRSNTLLPEEVLQHYADSGALPTFCEASADLPRGTRLVEADLACLTADGRVRHDGARLASLLAGLSEPGGGC